MSSRQGREGEAIALLERLVSIHSVFPDEAQLAHFAKDYLTGCGFEVRMQEFAPGRFNVIAQNGPREGSVLLCGHLDTVPPYNYGKRNPFEMKIEGERITGLGSWDMKSGLALIMLCAKYCKKGKRGIRIVLTCDEENISEGTWFAQRNGEFGGCIIAIVSEIPDSVSGNGARPPLLLGRRGRAVYRFEVRGIGAHGAQAGGISALRLGMELVVALESISMPSHAMGACRLFVRRFSSESRSLSVPTEAVIEADVHYVPPYTPKSFMEFLQRELSETLKLPDGCSWSVQMAERKTPYLPAYETNTENAAIRRFLQSYRNEIGEPSFSYGLTVADENVIAATGIPVVTFGPEGGEAHSANEWVSKSDFLLLSEKFPKIVQEML